MAEGRPLHGDGIENLQDYVEERMTYASDSDEYAEANRTLERELADLQTLHQERGRPDARPDIDALIDEAQLRVDRMRQGSAGQLAVGSGSQLDPEKLPPEDQARADVTRGLNGQNG